MIPALRESIVKFYPEKITDFIYFGSSTKLRELSNLYTVDILYENKLYPSLEHIYQSFKFIESDRPRFTKEGDLGSFDAFKKFDGIIVPKGQYENKRKYWEKLNCVGIVAKLATNEKRLKGLGLTFKGALSKEFQKESSDAFRKILPLKYAIPKFRKILLDTGDKMLIEFSRFPNAVWAGIVKDGVLNGENRMGKLLMEIRENIRNE